MSKEPELTERIIIPMSKDMVQAIADYRFAARCETRSEAVRKLIEVGLKVEAKRLKT